MIRCKLIFLFGLIALTATSYAQTTLTGYVVNDLEEILPGVTVQNRINASQAMSDENGSFRIAGNIGDTLLVSYMGYETLSYIVQSLNNNRIQLVSQNVLIDDVVVVGYGTQKRSKLSGSISSVNKEALLSAPNTNAATALQGTVSGLRVQQTTGNPGASPTISFRGGTEFNGTGTPLYVVDGVIVPSLYGINASDIESIDLLKDAASTAIYGARASNGVVLVTTKKGRKGSTKVEYQLKHANNYVRRNPVEYLSAEDYIIWNRQGIASRYQANIADGNASQASSTANQMNSASWGWTTNSSYAFPDGKYTTQILTDQNRYLLGREGWSLLVDRNPIQPHLADSIIYKGVSQRQLEDLILQSSNYNEHYINFSGGSDISNFNLGIGTVKDVGMVIGSELKRHNMNFNGGLKVNKDLSINLNLAAYNVSATPSYVNASSTSNLGGVIQRFGGAAPTLRLYNDETGEPLPGGDANGIGSPLYFEDIYYNKTGENRFSGGLNIEYAILKNLKLVGNANGFLRFNENDTFTKAYQNGSRGDMITTRNASFDRNKTQQYTLNSFLQYTNSFGRHNVNALLGGEYFEYRHYTASASALGAATDFIPWMSASTEAVGVPSSAFSQWERMVSGIGRVNYDYDDRILFTMNLRYDGTSRLSDNKFDYFPGMSLGWNIHRESFFQRSALSDIVSNLKPRISWGQNGSVSSVGYFVTDAPFGNVGTYDGNAGVGPAGFINTALKWEKVSASNFGIDLGLFNNRVNFNVDYFIRDVYNKVASLGIPSWTGFSNYTTNLGQLRNKGIELETQIYALRNANGFNWRLGGTFTHVKNYVIELPDNGLDGNRQSTTEVWNPRTSTYEQVGGLYEGRRVGLDEVWAHVYDGIYTTQEQLDEDILLYNSNLGYSNKTLKFLGDARWRDINEDDIIDSYDRVYVGRTTPTIQGGFHSNLTWKGLGLYTQFDYALGFVIIDQSWLRGMAQAQGSANMPVDVKYTYSEYTPSGTLPRFYWANYGGNYIGAANYYQKGDYLALREVTLSYQLDEDLLQRWVKNRVKGVRAYVSGSNLAYFTRYNGTLPEVGGDDPGRFPLPRRMTFGLNITL
ncbi:SusC/RagA family TonB-linked outer membrane protein [Sphingobacterium sp. SGG-5]|uniref:SusC/RagA family TonB-linked outer membrane protein n=1 Tax=Sphingobacterium sp. SGG-5 TaxID=2710881 RepID=UPI0019D16138|nr:SusC/RagA family TonB-linked outer membrane protein [Sphingobacterium sp. SGG-5]